MDGHPLNDEKPAEALMPKGVGAHYPTDDTGCAKKPSTTWAAIEMLREKGHNEHV